MWYVRLTRPMPKVKSRVFVFQSEKESLRFQDRLLRDRLKAQFTSGEVGHCREIFPDW